MSQNSYEQAQAQLDSIINMVAALEVDYDRLNELKDQRDAYEAAIEDEDAEEIAANALSSEELDELAELEAAANGCTAYDEALQAIQEDPLCVEVRSGWGSPGGRADPEEFQILLCTGGPAVRIRGELDRVEPTRAWIEHQDWFEPWEEFHGDHDTDALLTYCRQFWFGE